MRLFAIILLALTAFLDGLLVLLMIAEALKNKGDTRVLLIYAVANVVNAYVLLSQLARAIG